MSRQFLSGRHCLLAVQLVLMISLGLIAASPLPEGEDVCTAESLKRFLNESRTTNEVELMYQHCRGKFLDENKLSDSVKQTVDEWIGTDLSKAETNQIFLVYELAITAPKPEKVSEQFAQDCRRMGDWFQNYWQTIEPLTQFTDINLDSLITNGDEEIDDQERQMFTYVQYSQFCRSLMEDADKNESEVDSGLIVDP